MDNIIISRIIKYLNGCIEDNHLYRIAGFIVKNYPRIASYRLKDVTFEGDFTPEEITDFARHFGFDSFAALRAKLVADDSMRWDQINARMLSMNTAPFYKALENSYSKEQLDQLLDELTELIFHKDRLIIIGSYFPSSLSVDFQTDLIVYGKEVIEYHAFDENFQFTEDDVVMFLTATGRTMEDYAHLARNQHICDSDFVLVTQNIKYKDFPNMQADYVIHLKGNFDGIQFNYQVLMVLDLLRFRYYSKYYDAFKEH